MSNMLHSKIFFLKLKNTKYCKYLNAVCLYSIRAFLCSIYYSSPTAFTVKIVNENQHKLNYNKYYCEHKYLNLIVHFMCLLLMRKCV